jgi:hypothetical protein
MRGARATIAILICAAFAGCGSAQPTTRLTAAQLAGQASAICQRAASEEAAPGSFGERVSRLQGIGRREIKDLRKLSPPSSEDATYHAFLAQGERLIKLAVRLSHGEGSAVAQQVIAEGRASVARLQALEQPLGLAACSAPTG